VEDLASVFKKWRKEARQRKRREKKRKGYEKVVKCCRLQNIDQIIKKANGRLLEDKVLTKRCMSRRFVDRRLIFYEVAVEMCG
jgi:hypothetical protein